MLDQKLEHVGTGEVLIFKKYAVISEKILLVKLQEKPHLRYQRLL